MSLSRDDNITYDLLQSINQSEEAVGAGSVQRMLAARGYTMAEATMGRLLRDMDCRGYTEKKSNQGRKLTESGRARLHELEAAQWQGKWTQEFMNAASSSGREHLIELLTARRPVEIEIARLAAKNATDKEVASLRSLVGEQEKLAKEGKPLAHLDTEFHRLLSRMSHNRILEAIVELLRKKQEDAAEFEEFRRREGSLYNTEHRKILDAIEQRDPDMAVLAMKRHISGLLHSLQNK